MRRCCQFSIDYLMQRLGLDIKNTAKGQITQQHRVLLQKPPEIEGSSLEDHMFLLQLYVAVNTSHLNLSHEDIKICQLC